MYKTRATAEKKQEKHDEKYTPQAIFVTLYYRSLRSISNTAVNTSISPHRQLHDDRLISETAARYRPVSRPMRSRNSTGVPLLLLLLVLFAVVVVVVVFVVVVRGLYLLGYSSHRDCGSPADRTFSLTKDKS